MITVHKWKDISQRMEDKRRPSNSYPLPKDGNRAKSGAKVRKSPRKPSTPIRRYSSSTESEQRDRFCYSPSFFSYSSTMPPCRPFRWIKSPECSHNKPNKDITPSKYQSPVSWWVCYGTDLAVKAAKYTFLLIPDCSKRHGSDEYISWNLRGLISSIAQIHFTR